MKKNVGYLDRLIRLVAVLALSELCLAGKITGIWSIVTWIVILVLALTAIFAVCPLYGVCRIRTTQQKKRSASGS
jgi:hypothetical protein